jgi:hypothetical protein
VTVPLPLLPLVAAGAEVAAALLSVVVLLALLELPDVEVLRAVVDAVEAFPAEEAAAT